MTVSSLIKNAEETVEKMKSASELPDEVKFISLVAQHGETDKAEEICEKMRSAGELPQW